ncbi:MAG: phenylalanine--tRNA ligase subunit beta [Gemmatimonadales bacterium]
MKLSRKWLEAFLRRPLEARDVAQRLTMLGAPVDSIEPLHRELEAVVVGLVEEVRPHPNADRLCITTVEDGSGTKKQVVCGAPNVTVGVKYPFARVGVTLPGGVLLDERKIRGELSQGMLCSAKELGLGQDGDGILELDIDAAPGTSLTSALSVADDQIVIDVTPNRPDLLGHKGVARELAASYGVPFRLPDIAGAERIDVPPARRHDFGPTMVGGVRVAVDDRLGCPRLHVAVIKGVKVGPSPGWMIDRLSAAGMRSINNVVDATNYVMLELNQPMHAYDLTTLKGPFLWVRRAKADERLVTLDGQVRALDGEMMVIADESTAIGIAGVMGAAHTEVKESTTDLVLECAYFETRSIRKTRSRLGLSTEASYRFERGIDMWGQEDAMRRCIEIILAVAGGTLVEAPVDVWPQPVNAPRIFLRHARLLQVLGLELPVARVEQCLTAIGCTVLSKPDDARMAVDVPGWRPDITGEIDLIEEVARIHGYEAVPTELRPFRVSTLRDADIEVVADRVRQGLAAVGLVEVQSLPFGEREDQWSVELNNPLSSEGGYLRRRLLTGLVHQIEANWAVQTGAVRLFEVGTVFTVSGPGQLPHEERHVAAVVTGARIPPHWSDGANAPQWDRWDLRALFEVAIALAHPDAAVHVEGTSWTAVTPDGQVVGRARELDADAPPWAAPVWGFEVALDPAPRFPVRYRPLPTTPAVARDLSLAVPAEVTAEALTRLAARAAGSFLEALDLVDEYRGPKLGTGARGLTIRLVFRAPDRTLRDAEVDASVAAVVKTVQQELGVQLRAS